MPAPLVTMPSERKQGRSLDRAKEIAAATVVKHHNEEDHPSNK
jgi:hypothetical protein